METAFRMQFEAAGGVRRAPRAGDTSASVRQRALRQRLPAGPAAGRARRPVHAGLLRRRPAVGHAQQSQRRRCEAAARTSTSRSPPCSTDLKQRGLLDDTLVIWGGEFGRTPTTESGDGRDHNPYGFTMWMAGGGVRGGMTYGATDDFGFRAVDEQGPRPRPARHDPAPAGLRPREAHLPLRRPRLPADRRVRAGREGNRQRLKAKQQLSRPDSPERK